MEILITDYRRRTATVLDEGNYQELVFTNEIPGGHISASFVVRCQAGKPYVWARHFNIVEIYSRSNMVWSGFIMPIERGWDDDGSYIRLECVGWTAKLQHLYGQENLVNEKGSTYITDHILTDSNVSLWIGEGYIDINDYQIPGTREYKPWRSYAEILDDINTFNGWDWFVRGNCLYWQPPQTVTKYRSSLEHVIGSVRTDPIEFANMVCYDYTDLSGVRQTGTVYDSASEYPTKEILLSLSGSMTSAQAIQAAEACLSLHNRIVSTAPCQIWYCEDMSGSPIPVAELWPGEIIRIEGLVPADLQTADLLGPNTGYDTYTIQSVTYDHDAKTASLSLGCVSHSLEAMLARLGGMT